MDQDTKSPFSHIKYQRSSPLFEPQYLNTEELELVRSRIKKAALEFSDDYEDARIRAKEKDAAVLKQVDAILTRPPTYIPKRRLSQVEDNSLENSRRTVFEEIEALEAFGRDTRPLREKTQRPPLPLSRFRRSASLSRESSISRNAENEYLKVRNETKKIVIPLPREITPDIYVKDESVFRKEINTVATKKVMTHPTEKTPEIDTKEKATVRRRLGEVEARLNGILDYETPSANNFKQLRTLLRDVNDKMVTHRLLLDRYSGLELKEKHESVKDRIENKIGEVVSRSPNIICGRTKNIHSDDDNISEYDPRLIPGYSTGLSILPSERNAELHNRIRSLLCRTRESNKHGGNKSHTKILPSQGRKFTV